MRYPLPINVFLGSLRTPSRSQAITLLKTLLAKTDKVRLNASVPKKKAIRSENKIESFGKSPEQLANYGKSHHFQDLFQFPDQQIQN